MGFPTFARPPCHQGQMAKVPPMGGDVNAGDYPTGTSCHRSTSATCPRPTSHSSMVNRDQTGVRPMYRSVMESQMLPHAMRAARRSTARRRGGCGGTRCSTTPT